MKIQHPHEILTNPEVGPIVLLNEMGLTHSGLGDLLLRNLEWNRQNTREVLQLIGTPREFVRNRKPFRSLCL